MFRAAATKLAHSSALPTQLTGNSDLRPLQEVIATQKQVMQSLQKLTIDLTKSTDALRGWANTEGEDLEDTFSGCSTLLNHWIVSLGSFASHIARIRECLKAIRTREESLEEMRNRKRSLASKADATEQKVLKMDRNSKNIRQQTDLLTGLREHIRALNTEIANEQNALSDYKRVKAREWMGVQFGALLQCSEKGVVVAKSCRSILGHVSTEKTPSAEGQPRYTNRPQVHALVEEAERELKGILFTNGVGDNVQQTELEMSPIASSPIQSEGSPTGGFFIHQKGPPIRESFIQPKQPPNDQQSIDLGSPPSYASPLVQPMSAQQMRHYASLTFPNNDPKSPGGFEFGQFVPFPQPSTYTPGQQTHFYAPDEQPEASPVMLSSPSPLDSTLIPDHGSQPSRGSTGTSESAPTPTPTIDPLAPLSPLVSLRHIISGVESVT